MQSDLIWENPASNRSRIASDLEAYSFAKDPDLILLPEMFTTGFTMSPQKVAEGMNGPTLQWMHSLAGQYGTALGGSLVISEGGHYLNRFVLVHPEGRVDHYDKRHLFALAGEHVPYQPGQQRKVFELKGWRLMPLICYDLRFPVWSRNDVNYDLLVYVANWPKPRHQAWRSLLVARAIENQAYVLGVNRWGQDNNGLEYMGGSVVVDYAGERRLELDKPGIATYTLDRQFMMTFREKLNFLADRDTFSIL